MGTKPREDSKIDLLKKLSWDTLEEWAGTRVLSRGQNYQRTRRVKDLAKTKAGALVAWVYGGEKYATHVDFEDGELISTCTCPYGGSCKHAVAVVLECLDHLKKNQEIPSISEGDKRLVLFQDFQGEESRYDEEEEEEDDEREIETPSILPRKSSKSAPNVLKVFLANKNRDELSALLQDLAEKYPVVREDIQDRQNLSKGSVQKTVAAIRKEIYELSAEPGWRNHWNDEGYIPDYSRVKSRLTLLLEKGHADEVVTLGEELLEAGINQVEMSNDEGETGNEISSCMDVVFLALPESSLSPVEQILWAINAELGDDYELCYGLEVFWKRQQKASDWSLVANALMERLSNLANVREKDGSSRNYQREQLSNWTIRALENAGRHEEIIPLCEKEAVATGSYVRLVEALQKANRLAEAEKWINKGVDATQKEWPGIAKQLRDMLREMREKKGDWSQVASFRVGDFLQTPYVETFKEMKKAAERVKVWPAVRTAAMHYLETGKLPQTDPSWPLPEIELLDPSRMRKDQFPLADELIDIAIWEKKPEEALRWYDHRASKKRPFWRGDIHRENEIAEVVAARFPDRALGIWKDLAEKEIAVTKPSAYQTAAVYLRKVRDLQNKLRREVEWKEYLSDLRLKNARKKKLIEILGRLENSRIIEGKQ